MAQQHPAQLSSRSNASASSSNTTSAMSSSPPSRQHPEQQQQQLTSRSGGGGGGGGAVSQQQQQQQTNQQHRRHRTQRQHQHREQDEPFLQRFLRLLAIVLKILFLPFERVSNWVFPPSEYDGLSPAVTSKAAQQFVSHLKSLQKQQQQQQPQISGGGNQRPNGNGTGGGDADANGASGNAQSARASSSPDDSADDELPWMTLGFAASKQDAAHKQGLLLLYLHSPMHPSCDRFCRNVLLHPDMIDFCRNRFVTALGVSIHTGQGAQLAQMLQAVTYPLLVLLQPSLSSSSSSSANAAGSQQRGNAAASSSSSSSMTLLFRGEGPMLLEMPAALMLPHLTAAVTRHEVTVAEREAQRIQREEDTLLRRQQDEEYHAALRADQEREERREREREEEERRKREEEELERREESRKEDKARRAREAVREEPAQGEPGSAMIRFVLPTGSKLNRRFYGDDTIGSVRSFLFLHLREKGAPMERIGLSTNFPRKSFNDHVDDHNIADDPLTLRDAGLCPQAVLMVQDLDA